MLPWGQWSFTNLRRKSSVLSPVPSQPSPLACQRYSSKKPWNSCWDASLKWKAKQCGTEEKHKRAILAVKIRAVLSGQEQLWVADTGAHFYFVWTLKYVGNLSLMFWFQKLSSGLNVHTQQLKQYIQRPVFKVLSFKRCH